VIIAIDLNSTIQNHIAQIILETKIVYNVKLTRRDFSVWNASIGKKYGIREFDRFAWGNPELQTRAPVYKDAPFVINNLRGQGHVIKIITATCMSYEQVKNWLSKHGITYDEIAMGSDKTKVNFDIIIDDSPMVLAEMYQCARKYLIFDAPWNQDQLGDRAGNWQKVREYLA